MKKGFTILTAVGVTLAVFAGAINLDSELVTPDRFEV
jgi:hypothetical protein